MQFSDLTEAQHHILQAYDRLAIASGYVDLEVLREAKAAVITAYLVARELPRAQEVLDEEARVLANEPPS